MTEERLTQSLDWRPQRHSVTGVSPSMEGAGPFLDIVDGKEEEGKRSFRKYFKKKRTIATASSLFADSAVKKERAKSPHRRPATPQNQELIRVMASVLHPQIHYKTIPITETSTAEDVIAALVDKFAVEVEDQNPAVFYLAETQEEEQGSYSRVLESGERVHGIQTKWKEDKNCYFTLNRKAGNEEELDSPVVISATVCSPSQDSLFSGSQVFLDEGMMSPTFSEFMSDSYFSVTSDGSSGAFSRAAFSPVGRLEGIFSFPDTSRITPSSPGGSPRGQWGVGDHRRHSAGHRGTPDTSTGKPTPLELSLSRGLTAGGEDGRNEASVLPVRLPDGDAVLPTPSTRPRRGSLNKERGSPQGRRESKLAIQRSMSEGLEGIMDRVVRERGQALAADSHTGSQEESNLLASQSTSLPSVKALACSPMPVPQRNYAQFVYSPPHPGQNNDSQAGRKEEEEEEKKEKEEEEEEEKGEEKEEEKEEEEEEKGEEKEEEKEEEEEEKGEEEEDSRRCFSRRSSSEISRIVSPNVHKVSKAVPHVQFATEITVHPTFHTAAGLYPTFIQSNYYSSEMDMFASISSMLSTKTSKVKKVSASSGAQQSKPSTVLPSNQPGRPQPRPREAAQGSHVVGTPGTLVSPTRKSKMIDEATRALKLRKSHTVSSEQPRKKKDSAASPSRSIPSRVSETNLVSLSHRDKLLERASSMFRRTRSFSLPRRPRQDGLSRTASDQTAEREQRSTSEPPSTGSPPQQMQVATPSSKPAPLKPGQSSEPVLVKPRSPLRKALFSCASPPTALAESSKEFDDSGEEGEDLVFTNPSALDSVPLNPSVLEQSVDSVQLQRKRLPSEADEVDTLPALVPKANFRSNLRKRFHSMDNLSSSVSRETDSRLQPRGHLLRRSLRSFTSLFSSRFLSGSHSSLSSDSLAPGKPSQHRRRKTDPTLSGSGTGAAPTSSQSVENLAFTETKRLSLQPVQFHDKNPGSMRKSQSIQCLDKRGATPPSLPRRKVSAPSPLMGTAV